jgi:ubiquinone/menaquinone biosynthesis C-methylase UbiE
MNQATGSAASAADLGFRHLRFRRARARPELDFDAESFDRIGASLLIPYVVDARGLLAEVRRLLRPNGVAVISSVLPNFDPSKLYSEAAQYLCEEGASAEDTEELLNTLRYFGNSVSRLVELEEDGRFHFYRPSELESLAREAGFAEVSSNLSYGRPAVASILRVVK